MILTDWFPPEVRPVHEGPYQVRFGKGEWFQYWHGTHWGEVAAKPDHCLLYSKSGFQKNAWRGIAK